MANKFYDHLNYPQAGSPGSSSAMRAELDSIETGFDFVDKEITDVLLSAEGAAAQAASSAVAALGSKNAAKVSEDNALLSKQNAALSETNANSSKVAAASSASSALSSKTLVEQIYDNFDDRYLGNKVSDPTLDNDGNALNEGTLYYNSTNKILRYYNGTLFVNAPSGSAINTSVTPTGNLVATNVQAALSELQTDIDTRAALSSSNVFTNTNTITANSTSPALTITQTGTGNAFVVEDSTSPDSTPFVIEANGNVLVGSTIAQAFSYTSSPKIQVLGTSQGSASLSAFSASASAVPPSLLFGRSRGTLATPTVVSSGDGIGQILFEAHDGSSLIAAAQILAEVDGTPALNSMPARLLFSTTPPGSATPVERMRISSDGNIGIGTGPANKFDVVGGTTRFSRAESAATVMPAVDLTLLSGVNTSNVGTPQLSFFSDRADRYSSIGHYRGAASTAIGLSFFCDDGAGAQVERLRITSAGQVTVTNNIAGGYVAHAAGTTAMSFSTANVVRVTPNATATYTTTVPAAGAIVVLSILTSGTTSYTITLGTGFKSTGTLATGTTTARYFNLTFVSDGTNLIETDRTVAIA